MPVFVYALDEGPECESRSSPRGWPVIVSSPRVYRAMPYSRITSSVFFDRGCDGLGP